MRKLKLCYIQYVTKQHKQRYSEVDIFEVTNLADNLTEEEIAQIHEQFGVEAILRMHHDELPKLLSEQQLAEYKEYASKERTQEEIQNWFKKNGLYEAVEDTVEGIRSDMNKEFLNSYLNELEEDAREKITDQNELTKVQNLILMGKKQLSSHTVDSRALKGIVTEIQTLLYG